jgi:hypothetical protein
LTDKGSSLNDTLHQNNILLIDEAHGVGKNAQKIRAIAAVLQ